MGCNWFSFRFEFQITEDGLVTEVSHHKDDDHEVINLKKVLASVFSAIGKVWSIWMFK